MNPAVSAGHELTLEVAKAVLREGGNAFDAAIAAYAAAFVTEPAMNSAGGGGFAMVRTAAGKAYSFDFFCQTPMFKKLEDQLHFFPIQVDFGDEIETFYIGLGSAAVPGAIGGIFSLHKRLGSMPIDELLWPAIQFAREGVALNDFQHYDLGLLQPIFSVSDTGQELYFNDGQPKEVGEVIKMPEFADFLESLAREGADLFYRGEVAARLDRDCREIGGHITRDDLGSYRVGIREPRITTFEKNTLLSMPFPAVGGAILTYLLKELFDEDFRYEFRSKDHQKLLYDAFVKADEIKKVPELLFEYLYQMKHLSAKQNRRGSTSHLNVIDRDQNAIALTMTIGEGSGYFIPGTQIHLNNMLGELSLLPEGLHSWLTGDRLHSMMSPSIVVNEAGDPDLLFGSGGASRIPFMLAQVIENLYRFRMMPNEALDAPRIHFEHRIMQVEESTGMKIPVNYGHHIKHWSAKSLFFGGVHIVKRLPDGTYRASGDKRRDGVAWTG